MINIWLFKPNEPEDFDFSNLEYNNGKRITDDWVNTMLQKSFIKKIKLKDDSEKQFLSGVMNALEYDNNCHMNKIEIYNHPNYIIEALHIHEYDAESNKPYNYISTVTNLNAYNVHGNCVFYKIDKKSKKTIDLKVKDVLDKLASFYWFRTYKLLNNGVFDEIAINNYEPEMDKLFKSYTKREMPNGWIILTDNQETGIEKLKPRSNNINDFNNLIFIKLKKYDGEMVDTIMKCSEHNKGADYRGMYLDLDEEYIIETFFS